MAFPGGRGGPPPSHPSLRPLHAPRFGEVGDERDHHPNVHAGADGDGESGKEQGPPGGDVGQREVPFVHRLGGLEGGKKRNKRLSDLF